MVVVAALAACAVAGYVFQGWGGLLLWPLAVCMLLVLFFVVGFVLMLGASIRRRRGYVQRVEARLQPLTTEQLTEIMRNPAHPDSQFALVELMRRGSDARPTQEQLFGMLTSGNSVLCGHAMANLQIFYPELDIPMGASNLDSPAVWQTRIEAFRKAGGQPDGKGS